jgi:hypothetical protein
MPLERRHPRFSRWRRWKACSHRIDRRSAKRLIRKELEDMTEAKETGAVGNIMQRIRDRFERDIGSRVRALCDNRTQVLQCVMEMHELCRDAADYLNNFQYAVDHAGEKVDASEIWLRLTDDMDQCLKRLTGRTYYRPSTRERMHRRAEAAITISGVYDQISSVDQVYADAAEAFRMDEEHLRRWGLGVFAAMLHKQMQRPGPVWTYMFRPPGELVDLNVEVDVPARTAIERRAEEASLKNRSGPDLNLAAGDDLDHGQLVTPEPTHNEGNRDAFEDFPQNRPQPHPGSGQGGVA